MQKHEIDQHIAKLMSPVTRAMTLRVKQIIQECAISADLQGIVTEWAANNLPSEANHLTKIREELVELEAAPNDADEMADIFLALLLHASRHNVDLMQVARDKFDIVKGRKYEMADGRCHHVKAT